VIDLQRGFKRRPNVHIVGRPRGDVASRFNLPLRSPRTLEFSFNGRGFRGRTELAAADVALLGDSFVEGWFVSDGETCAERLAARLGRPVANLGQSGYGLAQELVVLEREALRLRPRVVVWFFYEGNDLYDDQAFENTLTWLAGESGTPEDLARRMGYGRRRFRDGSLTLNGFAALRRALDPLVPNRAPYVGLFHDARRGEVPLYFYEEAIGELGTFERERVARAQATLRKGRDLCARHGARLILAYVPAKFRVYGPHCRFAPDSPCRSWRPWELPRRLQEFCDAEGIELLDLGVPFGERARAGELLYVPQDTHWDRGAHDLAAELLAARIRDPSAGSRAPAAAGG
jgi:hypothetical protein